MLGKLLKHEFRATGRIMLPVLGAVLALAVMANVSIRLIQISDSTFLTILFGLVIAAFVIGVIAAAVMTIVIMVSRFYRNLLQDEGYLMHTLPVSVHELIWSKLIVSFVWFAATFVIIWLVILLTVLIQTGTDLGKLFASFPSWAEIRRMIDAVGLRSGDLWLFGIELLLGVVLASIFTCLHFYAAMALGHMFSKDKILLSIVFYVGLSFVLSILQTGVGMSVVFKLGEAASWSADTAREVVRAVQTISGKSIVFELVQTALLYLATVLPLKKRLNLA